MSLRLLVSVAVGLAVMALAACSSAGVPEVPVNQDGSQDALLVSGRQIYIDRCANCHGNDGRGGQGPKLSAGTVVETYPEIADQVEIIANGSRLMPGFSNTLSLQELLAVTRFTREVL